MSPRRSGGAGERVFLGLGSNVGRRPDHLRRALRCLPAPEIRAVKTSFLYNTTPVGYTAQRDFLNGVLEIRTPLSPEELLGQLQETERRLGKAVSFRGGPRKIDIDLLLYGDRVVKTRDLTLPHPRLHRRKFVLVPLAQIAPSCIHPVMGKSVARLLGECRSGEEVKCWGKW
jgi:2-amino-4-hydroxy-6-hydroxymethyldihydropteridine diphosphokinase